jgi:hypothetical protein
VNRLNKFSENSLIDVTVSSAWRTGNESAQSPFANMEMPNNRYLKVVICRVCGCPPKFIVGRGPWMQFKTIPIPWEYLVLISGNYYLVCSPECGEQILLNPLPYE